MENIRVIGVAKRIIAEINGAIEARDKSIANFIQENQAYVEMLRVKFTIFRHIAFFFQ